MAAPIDFYFDFSSPYGFLASTLIGGLAARHGRTVDWHPILLGVVFKQTGMAPLTQIPIKGDYSKRDFARSARFHGVTDFRMPTRFPIPAQAPSRATLWANRRDPERGRRLAKALYRAFFVDDRDISDPEVVVAVAGEEGFDPETVRKAINDPEIKQALFAENEQAMRRGVFGSPFVFADGEPFWGVDRFDQIDRWLATGGF